MTSFPRRADASSPSRAPAAAGRLPIRPPARDPPAAGRPAPPSAVALAGSAESPSGTASTPPPRSSPLRGTSQLPPVRAGRKSSTSLKLRPSVGRQPPPRARPRDASSLDRVASAASGTARPLHRPLLRVGRALARAAPRPAHLRPPGPPSSSAARAAQPPLSPALSARRPARASSRRTAPARSRLPRRPCPARCSSVREAYSLAIGGRSLIACQSSSDRTRYGTHRPRLPAAVPRRCRLRAQAYSLHRR